VLFINTVIQIVQAAKLITQTSALIAQMAIFSKTKHAFYANQAVGLAHQELSA
jgi:hypothetical protein